MRHTHGTLSVFVFSGALLASCGTDATSHGSGTSDSGAGGEISSGGTPNSGGAAAAAGGTGKSGAAGTGQSGAAGTGTAGGGSGSGGRSGSTGGGASAPDGGGSLDGGAARPCPGARPDATNTGVPSGVALTAVNHDVTVTADGTTIDSQDIHGFLVIKASHVRVTRSRVRGGVASANGDGIRVASGTDILIEDTEIGLETPSAFLDGVSGSNFTVRRANIHGGVDGMKLGSNSTVECSFIHDMKSFASDPNQGGGATHNDAIQILSGTSIHITGNALVAAKDQNSAIQVTEDFGAVGDLHIEANFADGGGCTFNLSHKGAASLKDVFTTDNRFGRNSFYDCPILKSTQTTLVSTRDVWDDDGTPVPIQTHD
jgi:hypothetical protein